MAEKDLIQETTIKRTEIKPTEPQATLLSNIIAIVGLIVLIVVIIWGLVHLAGLSQSFFSSLFGRPAATLGLTAPASATSRVPFNVSWSYKPTVSGSYAFLYQCASGFQFETSDGNGVSNQIPCGASFTIPATANSIMLTPVLSSKNSMTVPISVVFIPSSTSSSRVQGSTSILVSPALSSITPAPTTPTKTSAKPRASVPADLSVRIVSLSVDPYGNGTAVFDIQNVGAGSSGTYSFTAQLPTNSNSYGGQPYGGQTQSYTYASPAQSSLHPGDHIINTLRFTQAQSGGIFSVTVDPSGSVHESNKINNYAYQSLSTQSNYNQPQPYYTY